MNEIQKGTRLAPGEVIVWQGAPEWKAVARDVLHVRAIAAYLAFLLALDAAEAWSKAIALALALHNSVPLFVIIAFVLVNVCGIAWLIGRTTRYTITDRRVILDYGIAINATLSLPHVRIRSVSVAVNVDHTGDIPLSLAPDDHMPFLKLWPHARPWRIAHPQPMLRSIPRAAVVAGLLTRAVASASRERYNPDTRPEADILAA